MNRYPNGLCIDIGHMARTGGWVNLEYEFDPEDPLPGLKQSFTYMRGVIAGMATAG